MRSSRGIVPVGSRDLTAADVVTDGAVEDDEVAYAVRRLTALTAKVDEPILLSRVRLTRAGDPARERPAIAQATIDVNGDVMRAHVAARTMEEALDLLQQRLRDKLGHRAERREARRTWDGVARPGLWRHGDVGVRPEPVVLEPAEKNVVAHRTFASGDMTPDEAAFEMDQLDFDFHLYRDIPSGADAMIERHGDGYRLTRLEPVERADEPVAAVPVEVTAVRPPRVGVDDAFALLVSTGQRHLFFEDAGTGRGAVVHHRLDGHLGLVTMV
jgi:hypothetical protein